MQAAHCAAAGAMLAEKIPCTEKLREKASKGQFTSGSNGLLGIGADTMGAPLIVVTCQFNFSSPIYLCLFSSFVVLS